MTSMLFNDYLGEEQWKDVRRLTDGSTEYAPICVHQAKVLVVGAGGLGCELLKNLALSGFKNIHVIDMDTIDLSNLNRQFLFRESDVGKSKAEVAANFIERRVSGCKVTAHNCRIEEKSPEFYRQFQIVICGLDSIAARRWINAMLIDLAKLQEDGNLDLSTVIPMVDGGTEGFKGNARVIYPRMSACIDCTLTLFPPQINFPMCTIANTPRLPEHCIEYIKVVTWPNELPFNGANLDADNPEHVDWVLEKSLLRANQFGIAGVDRRLTQGVLKRIIPAVASTNAVIAASCALEAFKLASNTSNVISNYLNFTDIYGAFCGVVQLERDPECNTCSTSETRLNCSPDETLEEVIEKLTLKFQLKNPTVQTQNDQLYVISDFFPDLKEASHLNLVKPMKELVRDGQAVLVSDVVLPRALQFSIAFKTREE